MGLKELLLRNEAEEILSERQALVSKLQKLEAEHLATIKPLRVAEESALAGIKKAEADLQQAKIIHGEAMCVHITCSNAYGREWSAIEKALRDTASPLITEFITSLRNLYDRVGQPNRDYHPPGRFSSIDEQKASTKALQEAWDKRQAHLSRIASAIKEAQGLWCAALSDDALATKLDALRRMVGEADA